MLLKRVEAYQKLRDAITFGQLSPGERIVENDLCKRFALGRTPLREALRQLNAEGYVEVFPNKGAVVKKISVSDMEHIYEIVAVLERYAVDRAAGLMGRAQRAELKEIERGLARAGVAGDISKWLEYNALFHGYFPNVVGNPVLTGEIEKLRTRLYRFRFLAFTSREYIKDYMTSHRKILEAVLSGDAHGAGRMMQEHVLEVKRILIEFLERSPFS